MTIIYSKWNRRFRELEQRSWRLAGEATFQGERGRAVAWQGSCFSQEFHYGLQIQLLVVQWRVDRFYVKTIQPFKAYRYRWSSCLLQQGISCSMFQGVREPLGNEDLETLINVQELHEDQVLIKGINMSGHLDEGTLPARIGSVPPNTQSQYIRYTTQGRTLPQGKYPITEE